LPGVVLETVEHALTGCVPLAGVHRAAAMTDGASCLVDLYEQLAWEQAPAELVSGGPADWIRRVRRAESDDPQATRWLRYKRGDDATVAFIEF
jgi:hypothetical protein